MLRLKVLGNAMEKLQAKKKKVNICSIASIKSFVYLQNSQTVHALEVRLKHNSQVVALKIPEKDI